jgi:serine/threonine-protein kinase
MGTVQYLSPEQASGHPASPTTDIYSLGIVAYEALAGRRPFTGESQVAIAMAQINETPPELPATIAEPVRNLVYSCIAKSPADRPASAAHLARAAQALRRGDVPGAATSVPGVVGTGSLAAAVGANYGNPTTATRILPTTSTLPTATSGPKKRNPWTWPLIALVALLAVVLVGTIIALLASPSGPPAHSPTGPTSHTPSSTPTPTHTLVTIQKSDIVGLTKPQVQAFLTGKGLVLSAVDGDSATTAAEVGTAEDAQPIGNVEVGATITVKFYKAIATPEPPSTPVAGTAGPYTANQSVDVSWSDYAGCPSDLNLSGYNVTVNGAGASTSESNPITPSEAGESITLGNSGTTTVTYTAICGIGSSSIQSAPSSPLSFAITS